MQPQLHVLHEQYVRAVNEAVGADEPELVAELAQEYFEAALHLVLAAA